MSKIETYNTIDQVFEGEYKEKGSKFLAFCYPLTKVEQVSPIIKELKAIHFKAVHHCFAFRIGHTKNEYRANDDGEPSGSAGMPILGQIDSHKLTNVLIVVVRYYGGTKLGVPGLINAYKTAPIDALSRATVITKIIGTKVKLSFDYGQMSEVMNISKHYKDVEVLSQDFNETPSLTLNIPNSLLEEFKVSMKAKVGHLHKEEITEETDIEGLIFKILPND